MKTSDILSIIAIIVSLFSFSISWLRFIWNVEEQKQRAINKIRKIRSLELKVSELSVENKELNSMSKFPNDFLILGNGLSYQNTFNFNERIDQIANSLENYLLEITHFNYLEFKRWSKAIHLIRNRLLKEKEFLINFGEKREDISRKEFIDNKDVKLKETYLYQFLIDCGPLDEFNIKRILERFRKQKISRFKSITNEWKCFNYKLFVFSPQYEHSFILPKEQGVTRSHLAEDSSINDFIMKYAIKKNRLKMADPFVSSYFFFSNTIGKVFKVAKKPIMRIMPCEKHNWDVLINNHLDINSSSEHQHIPGFTQFLNSEHFVKNSNQRSCLLVWLKTDDALNCEKVKSSNVYVSLGKKATDDVMFGKVGKDTLRILEKRFKEILVESRDTKYNKTDMKLYYKLLCLIDYNDTLDYINFIRDVLGLSETKKKGK